MRDLSKKIDFNSLIFHYKSKTVPKKGNNRYTKRKEYNRWGNTCNKKY